MKASDARPGGRFVFIERGGLEAEVAVPVQEALPEARRRAAVGCVAQSARMSPETIYQLSRISGMSLEEFIRRYSYA